MVFIYVYITGTRITYICTYYTNIYGTYINVKKYKMCISARITNYNMYINSTNALNCTHANASCYQSNNMTFK